MQGLQSSDWPTNEIEWPRQARQKPLNAPVRAEPYCSLKPMLRVCTGMGESRRLRAIGPCGGVQISGSTGGARIDRATVPGPDRCSRRPSMTNRLLWWDSRTGGLQLVGPARPGRAGLLGRLWRFGGEVNRQRLGNPQWGDCGCPGIHRTRGSLKRFKRLVLAVDLGPQGLDIVAGSCGTGTAEASPRHGMTTCHTNWHDVAYDDATPEWRTW